MRSAAPGAAVHPTVRLHRTHARQRAKHGGHNHPPSPTSTHATAGTIVDLQRMRNDIRHDEQKKQRLLQKLRSKNASLKALLQETSVEQLVSATLRDGHCITLESRDQLGIIFITTHAAQPMRGTRAVLGC